MWWSEHQRRSRAEPSLGVRFLAGLVLAGALAGCGFHLRGQIDYPFQSIYLNAPTAPVFAAAMQRAIESYGAVKVEDTAAAAQVTLDIPNVTDDKQVLSLSGGGRVREYSLTKRVSFALHDASGRDWLPAGEVTVRRTYSFNESEVLARESQELKLLSEMQSDAVQQVLRRLQTAKKPSS